MEPRSLAYQSGTLTITPNCFLCLCEAIIEPYSCLGDSVQFIEFIEFNENLFILEKLDCFFQVIEQIKKKSHYWSHHTRIEQQFS